MLFHDLIPSNNQFTAISAVIKSQCGDFLRESNGLPLYKSYPAGVHTGFKRVKVRFQRRRDPTSKVFESAFGTNTSVGFRERSVITTGAYPAADHPFYVFPTDGYEYIFSKQVKNSASDLTDVLNTISEQLDADESHDIVTDLLKYSYQNTNLVEGIVNDCEIIIHNISSFYIVDAQAYPNYNLLIS